MAEWLRSLTSVLLIIRALDHSIISPLWVRASLGAEFTCGTSQVLLAGVSGGFSPGTPVFAPPI